MISKTRGVVLNYIKYQESSIIVKAFTEEFGMSSYIVNGIRSQKSRKSIGFFQPFSLLEMVVYMKTNREIQRLSEWKSFHPTFSLHQNIYKGTIVLFLSEILGKILVNEPAENKTLFDFLSRAIITLDQMESRVENFHLHFLLKIMPHLGFGVEDGEELLRSMELENIHNDPAVIGLISQLLRGSILDTISSTGQRRFETLETILAYYNHHNIHIGEVKSLKVLHQVFG